MTPTNRLLALVVSVLGSLSPVAAFSAPRPSIAALQAEITAQQARITALEGAPIQDLNGYVTMDLSTPSRPTLRVAGANLQVVNGLGTTDTVNGLGNVIVGYDEAFPPTLPAVCSIGEYTSQATCISGGGTWAVSHKSGSHNLVVGLGHRYSRYGGLVAGEDNTVNGERASVSGGFLNIASGVGSSVSGGGSNHASGLNASISGGVGSLASGSHSSVSGGDANLAGGAASSVSGGFNSTVSGPYASVSGGYLNAASGNYSNISGGRQNAATGNYSSISGGLNHSAINIYDWVAGALFQDQ